MDILTFAYGMLTMVAIAFAVVVVVGIVKVFKQQKKITHIFKKMDEGVDWSAENHRRLDQRIDDGYTDLSNKIANLQSYVDSRFDKAISKIGNRIKENN